jgi:outer membrane protein assembly factor BamB
VPANHPAFCSLLLALLVVSHVSAAENWPRWRGPRADGHSADTGVPVTWNASQVLWKTSLPGRGQSSPIIWEGRIFLTTAVEEGLKRQVLCVDRTSGKILWSQNANWTGDPEKLHKMNSYASATCVTDGQRVVAFFGRGGLHCYSIDGKHLWSQDVGPFEGNPWGTAACPVLVGDLVIQNCDNDIDARLMAFNKHTGELVWKTQRPEYRGWSTPVLVRAGSREELLLNGDQGVTAYDPTTGQQLWFCKGFNGRGEPTVTPGKELVYLVNGKAGDIYAVQPGGEGDVTASRMAWHTPRRSGRDLPSPILIDKYLLVTSMSGILTCYDSSSGQVLFNERVGGNYSASPIAAHGLAYFQADEGDVVVVEPGPALKIVARNTVDPSSDEIFRGSPAVYDGQIFLRSDKVLYCIGKQPRAGE